MIGDYWHSRRRIYVWAIAILLAYVALAPGSACKPYALVSAGYRTLGMVRDAGDEADRQVAAWLRARGAACLAEHKDRRAPGYADCINPSLAKQSMWRVAAVGVSAALALAKGALLAYHRWLDGAKSIEAACLSEFRSTAHEGYGPCVEAGRKRNWLVLLQPAVCGLAKPLRLLSSVIPALQKIAAGLRLVEGVTCD